MPEAPHIAIIGAGLSGLCLAQGLRMAGLDVAVYERDENASVRAQGYRISMDARGTEALRACLPDRLYELFEATCGQPSTGVTAFSSDGLSLRQEATMSFPDELRPGVPAVGRAVDRLILRETLLAGLDGIVHFGKEFTSYDLDSTSVEARFADGTAASCDVLIAADGVGSRVRQQFLPNTKLVDTGMRWLGGRTVLDDRLRGLLPDALTDKAVTLQDRGKAWFLAPVFFTQRPEEAAQAHRPGLDYTDNDDFLMWALVGLRGEFMFTDEQLFGASEAELHDLALGAVEGCHPMLSMLIGAATPDRSFSLAIRALPVVDPWPSSRITFLGDAIHASPVNGTGANSALEDAALLCTHLITGRAALQHALDEYESELLKRVRAMRAGLAQTQAGTILGTLGQSGLMLSNPGDIGEKAWRTGARSLMAIIRELGLTEPPGHTA